MTKARTSVAFLAFVFSTTSYSAPPADLDAYVGRAMKQFEAPAGLAIAIVEDSKTTLAKGYGLRKLGGPQPVDEHTVFAIGSCGKAFTTTALALLVDEGKLSWGDKVANRLDGFRMYDGFATLEMTIRDLLVHNSGLGLGAGDLMFFPATDLTRQEVVERLRHIKPATSFRSAYAYDNVLYIAAGRMIEQLSGQSWESFVAERLFRPLGMRDSVPAPNHLRSDNYAWPHARLDGPLRGLGTPQPLAIDEEMKKPDVSAPAGAILSSAADMARWLQTQLDRGKIAGTEQRLFSAESAEELWTPRTIQPQDPLPELLALTAPTVEAYALGWDVRDYRGHKLITHSGAVEGSLAIVAILPARRVAFAIMINSEDGAVRQALYYRLLDHYIGAESPDWIDAYRQVREQRIAAALKTASADVTKGKQSKTKPSLAPGRYAGVYRDDWYGTMTITNENGKLRIRFDRTPSMVGDLEHLHHDTFRAHWDDRRIEDAYVTFSLDHEGVIDEIRMKAISPLADFSFDYHDLLFRPHHPSNHER
jgi:CubicO group peptidase (beta-lactamase class C family)